LGLVLWLSFVTIGHAQGTRGAYAGGGLGMLSYDGTGGPALSDDRNAYRLLAGYRFSDRYAVEAGFGSTADVSRTFSTFAVRGIAMLPLSRVGLYAGAGYYEATFNKSMPISGDLGAPGFVVDDSEDFEHSQRGVTVVGGIMLDLPRISLRAEYEWLDTDSPLEASSVNLLALFRF
jgi:hypothetical protein